MVDFALRFGPAEYFALMVLAFVTVSAVLGSSAVRGLTSLFFGIFLGLIGIDLQTGQARFTFGMLELLDGVNVIVVAVGLFAVGETFYVAARRLRRQGRDHPLRGSLYMTKEEWSRSWKPWLRGTFIGFPIGAMPAGGAEVPTFLSYWLEKKLSKKPEEFGTTGAIEGVAGPEAANNASAAGVLVPMLTLGLPTSATAAIMLSAFQSYGINPGPCCCRTSRTCLGPHREPLHRQRDAARPQPSPGRPVGAHPQGAGAAALRRHPRLRDHRHLRHLELGGRPRAALRHRRDRFLMRRFDFPTAPVVIGMILGPLAEQELRRALTISNGDASVFITQPLAAALLFLAAAAVVGPKLYQFTRRQSPRPEHVPGDA